MKKIKVKLEQKPVEFFSTMGCRTVNGLDVNALDVFKQNIQSVINNDLDKLIDYGDTLNLIQADETNRKVERKDIPLIERVGSNKTGYWKVKFVQ